ncbi:sigma-70 family RNA polymerase sigma factor [Acetobacteraceae bacterium H6797]|nr:sigma-70 family RNA polymerase sigma factor [Acetobacteraceae bacterium H6797]
MYDLALPYQWLDRLFRKEQRRLQRRLTRWVGCEASAEDVLQDTFLRLASSPSAASADNPSAYLGRAAHHAMVDRLRGPAGRPSGQEALDEQMASPEPLPDTVLEHRDRVRRFAAAIQSLPAAQQAMIIAARVDGLSYAAIAERHGTSPAAVEKTIARALKRIALAMGEHEASP